MKTVRMTERWLRSISVESGREEFTDAIARGLRIRVSKRAKKWSLVTRHDGRLVRLPLGDYPTTGLLEVRGIVNELQTTNSRDDLEAAITRLTSKGTPLLSQVCQDYADELKAKGKPSAREYERALIISPLSFCSFMQSRIGVPAEIGEVKTAHVADWLRETYARAPSQAKHSRAYLHAVFEWAIKAKFDYTTIGGIKDYGIDQNPVGATPTFKANNARKRVLSLEELAQFYDLLPKATGPQIAIGLRMIVAMGGLRITEIMHSRKEWYSDGWLTLPETKNGREHSVPLTKTAQALITEALVLSDAESPYIFPHLLNSREPILITSVGRASRRLIERFEMAPFQLRDIRRTMKTHLLDLGFVEEREIDIWHNHGQNSDVARKHYTWAEYRDLKQRVALKIDEFLKGIANSATNNGPRQK